MAMFKLDYRNKMLKNISCIAAVIILFASCKQKVNITADKLYGKWNYVKVENPYAHPPDSVKSDELKIEKPYILFSKDSLQMWWGGGLLSRGSYTVSGDSIQYKEILPGGQTRVFPFIVSKLTDKEIEFETTGEDGSLVTAVKAH
jgi:hypothetical protein